MKKIMFLLFLVTGIIGCSVEPLDTNVTLKNNNGIFEVNVIYEIDGFETTSWDFKKEKKNGNEYFGTLHVTNDCENLYISLEGSDDVNLGVYENSDEFPTANRNGKVPNGLELDAEDAVDLVWTFPLNDFSESVVSIFANTANIWVGDQQHEDVVYFNYEFQLDSCVEVCTYGKGWWKNHSNDNPGEQDDLWPVDELILGNKTYSQDQLNTIFDVPNNEGNNLVIFSHHLIAAKLNVANGAGNAEIEATIEEADELIGDLVVMENSFSDDQKEDSSTLKAILEAFNESNSCDDE